MSDRVHLSRRAFFVGASGLALAACDSMKTHDGFLGRMERWSERFQRSLLHDGSRGPAYGARDETPIANMPAYYISPTMPIAPPNWTLRVGGLVARPRVFTKSDLLRMTRTDERIQHHCVEGWSVIESWHGVRLRDLAEIVGADPRAEYVEFRSFDNGYFSSWDRESALHRDTILAYGVAGRPLGAEHGAPLRLYSSVKLGYKNVKYLTEVNFLPTRTGGYWEDMGYEWFAGT
jgi:DMSO/TMAO reductase YedYZ molybdopterin-dependent catalytic subunit